MERVVRYELDGQGVVEISWDLPGKSVNILSPEAKLAFVEAVDRAIADDRVKGVIVTSAKSDFVVGADLGFLQAFRGADPQLIAEEMGVFRDCLRRIERCTKPFVAAMPGTALGGGLELCLACNYRLVAENPAARLGLPEVSLSLMPGAGGTQRLSRMIGVAKALPLLLDGARLTAAQALEAGIIDGIVAPERLLQAAREWIEVHARAVQPWDLPGFALPGPQPGTREWHQLFVAHGARLQARTRDLDPAPSAILSAVFEGVRLPMDAALRVELGYFVSVLRGDVAQNVVRSMFYGIQEANRLAARPKNVPQRDPKIVGIVGAGLMGAGLAEVSILAGLEVVLLDRSEELATASEARIAASLARQVEKGRVGAERAASALDRLKVSHDYGLLRDCDLVIEAVFEDRAVKADVFARVQQHTAPEVLLATNTSKIPITGLAAKTAKPDRFIGLHFFSPVPRMPLVEVICGRKTSSESLAQALDFVKKIRKTPIVVRDGPGFYTSRCVSSYLNEGITLLAQGIAPDLIENCARIGGMPLGPMSLADQIGLDLMLSVRKQERADGVSRRSGAEFDVLEALVTQDGRLGRKAKAGFWNYPDGEEKAIWPELVRIFPPVAQQPSAAEVTRRLMHVQALEAARCFDEGIIDSARDADIGSILGWGFPKQTGGVISYIDTIGSTRFVEECDALADRFGERYVAPPLLRDMARRGLPFHSLPQVA